MKYIYVVLIALLLSAPVLGQKPPTITIKAAPDRVKAELIRLHAEGYELCKERASQLTFCKAPENPKRAFVDHIERSFTLASSDGSTEVIANSEVRRVNIFGGERRVRGMDKRERESLQAILDALKKLEAH